jgi:diacylglycerol kinase
MFPFFKSFIYAFNGLKIALSERNMRVHIVCALTAIILGFVFHISMMEWIIVLICIGLVIALEMINTAIEYLVNLVSPEFNEKAGKIKDIAAGAVLVISFFVLIVGFLIFWKHLLILVTS